LRKRAAIDAGRVILNSLQPWTSRCRDLGDSLDAETSTLTA
jgi:hypothetical protein